MNLRMTAAAACALLALTACGGEDADPKGAEDPKATAEAKPYATGIDDPFTYKDLDGPNQIAYGHGIVIEFPDGWKARSGQSDNGIDSGPDSLSGILAVAGEEDAPQNLDATADTFIKLGEGQPGAKIGEPMTVKVPGAVGARLVEFTQDRSDGKVDSTAVFIQPVKQRGSSIFLSAPRGERDAVIGPIVKSLEVQLK